MANTGRKHSIETRRMMSERNKGKRFGVWTEESGKKVSLANTGRKHSPESIERMRAAARRRVRLPDGRFGGVEES